MRSELGPLGFAVLWCSSENYLQANLTAKKASFHSCQLLYLKKNFLRGLMHSKFFQLFQGRHAISKKRLPRAFKFLRLLKRAGNSKSYLTVFEKLATQGTLPTTARVTWDPGLAFYMSICPKSVTQDVKKLPRYNTRSCYYMVFESSKNWLIFSKWRRILV